MDKVVILGSKNVISNKVSKWISMIIGTVYLILGSIKTYEKGSSFESVGWLLLGACFLIYGLLVFTATPLTPKMRINDVQVELKNKIFSKTTMVIWTDVQSITFGQFMIIFKLKDRDEVFNYSSNADASIEIKSSIREIAKSKHIQVSGG
ncbi:MAG: hypothetical protein RIA69_17125 [Cyclobacteriaceae bacterium]